MKTFSVFLPETYWGGSSGKAHWYKRVKAIKRADAILKCMMEIQDQESTMTVVGTKFSVFCGETHNPGAYASRLEPFQFLRGTCEPTGIFEQDIRRARGY